MKKIRIKLNNIDVSKMTPPHKAKLLKYSSYYNSVKNNNSLLNKVYPIVIDSENAIIDGYCTYLLIAQSEQKTITCIKTNPNEKLVKVIHAKHKRKNHLTKKTYAWRVKKIPIVPKEILWIENSPGLYFPIIPQKIEMLPEESASRFLWLKKHVKNNQ